MGCEIRISSWTIFVVLTIVAAALASQLGGIWAGVIIVGIMVMTKVHGLANTPLRYLLVITLSGIALIYIFKALAIPDGFNWALVIWLLALIFLYRR